MMAFRLRLRSLDRAIARGEPKDQRTAWYGLRARDRAVPLSPLGRRTLGAHLVATTTHDTPIEDDLP